MGAFPECMASLALLGYQAVTDEMAVRELKVFREDQGGLDPRGLLVYMERMALRESLDSRDLLVSKAWLV